MTMLLTSAKRRTMAAVAAENGIDQETVVAVGIVVVWIVVVVFVVVAIAWSSH